MSGRETLNDTYAQGWHECAKWAKRDDLHHDVDSSAYKVARDRRLADLAPELTAEMDRLRAEAMRWRLLAEAIRDNGDIIGHMATLDWFAAQPTEQPADKEAKRLQFALDMLVAAGHVRKEKVDFALAWAAESMI
jgi:hypothetical protein